MWLYGVLNHTHTHLQILKHIETLSLLIQVYICLLCFAALHSVYRLFLSCIVHFLFFYFVVVAVRDYIRKELIIVDEVLLYVFILSFFCQVPLGRFIVMDMPTVLEVETSKTTCRGRESTDFCTYYIICAFHRAV